MSNLGVETTALVLQVELQATNNEEGPTVTEVTIYHGTALHEHSLKGVKGKVISPAKLPFPGFRGHVSFS